MQILRECKECGKKYWVEQRLEQDLCHACYLKQDIPLKNKLENILSRFDEQLSCFSTDYVEDEDENGKCLVEVNTLDDIDLDLLRKVYYDLENLVCDL